MTNLQKAQLKLEERRRELGKLLDLEERGDDFTDKLAAAKKAVESASDEVGAAGLTETPVEEHRAVTSDGVELREMLGRANIGHMFESAVGARVIDGVEAELQQHYKLPANSIPVAMLEERAAATQTGDEPGSDRPVIPQLFPAGAAAFAGVSIETVPSGQAQYPVLTTGAIVRFPTQGADADETTGAFTISTLTPKRLQAAFSYQVEDASVFSYMPDALRQNLSDALQAKLDFMILTRSGDGLLDFGTDPPTPGAATTAAAFIASVYDGVDGLYAMDASEVRLLVGSGASGSYGKMGGLAVATGSDINVAQKIDQVSGGLRVSGHVPAYGSNRQEAVVIKGPARRNCVAAVWAGVQLIPDMVTRAKQGEVILTAVMLYDFKIVREAGYTRHRFRS